MAAGLFAAFVIVLILVFGILVASIALVLCRRVRVQGHVVESQNASTHPLVSGQPYPSKRVMPILSFLNVSF